MDDIRKMAVAGRFYPASAVRVKAYIDAQLSLLQECDGDEMGVVRAVVVPHAGFHFSGSCAAKVFSSLVSAKGRIKRIVVLAPSHYQRFKGVSIGCYEAYETPFGNMPVDVEACDKLISACMEARFRVEVHANEHAIEVQLPFLYQILGSTPIVPILCGSMTAESVWQLATLMESLWSEDTLWVVSSDFTHYGASFNYLPFTTNVKANLRALDGGAIAKILANDVDGFRRYIEDTGATVCGHNPIELLLTVVADDVLDISLVDYTTSAAFSGEKDLVSYAGLIFTDKVLEREEKRLFALNDDERRLLHELVKEAIEANFEGQELFVREEILSDVLCQKACCFVTLYLDGKLRGCVGCLEATESLYINISYMAQMAAFEDYRFMPLTYEEFQEVEVEISVLTPAVEVKSHRDIVLGRDGIILEKGRHHAVFLPQVAVEQGWDLEMTLSHLSEKAGMEPNGWRSHTKFRVFEAYVF